MSRLPRGEGHTLTGVWIETQACLIRRNVGLCHTLTGVWIETHSEVRVSPRCEVTPSRVCGLKHHGSPVHHRGHWVTPSRVCGLKRSCTSCRARSPRVTPSRVCGLKRGRPLDLREHRPGHTLTGVWIETSRYLRMSTMSLVTPSRVCGLKRRSFRCFSFVKGSHPHGCVD